MTEKETEVQPRFGTFLGVFTPSILTILGVMMYLRFGWVIGNAGLPLALLILLMASSITFVTGLSASAISTNMKVGVGGEYFRVSRSLGLELGGAIGIPLFLCRTLSLTLYAFGLAESFGFVWPHAWGDPPLQWIAAVIIVAATDDFRGENQGRKRCGRQTSGQIPRGDHARDQQACGHGLPRAPASRAW